LERKLDISKLSPLNLLRWENSQCTQCIEDKPFLGEGTTKGIYVLSDTYYEGRYKKLLDGIFPVQKYVSSPLRCKCKQIAKNLNNCKSWTLKELDLIRPEKIICMGGVSTHQLKLKHFHQKEQITLSYGPVICLSTYSLRHLSMRKDLLEETRKQLEQF
jgi:uracil-DNA glycosylase